MGREFHMGNRTDNTCVNFGSYMCNTALWKFSMLFKAVFMHFKKEYSIHPCLPLSG